MCLPGKENYMRKRLNTSTALIASLSLMAGGPVYPQETAPADPTMICADGSAQPCADGVPLVPAPEAVPETAPAEEPAPEPAPEAVAPEPEPAPQAAPEPEAAPEPAPAEAAPEAAAPEDAPVAEQPVEAAPAAEAPAEVAPAEEAPVAEQPTEAAPEAVAPEVTAPAQPAPVEQAPAPDAAEPAPATEAAPAETAPAAEATDSSGEGVTEPAPAPETAAEEPVPVLPVQPDAATGEAPVAAAATADPEAAAPADAEVSEEVVTEDTARSSAEDFANPVNQPATAAAKAAAAQPAAPNQPAAEKKKGLSDGEKAVLLGLGALAVGAMISNNRKVELNSGDRVVVERPDGTYQIIKDDNALLRQPGSTVRTERFDDGSSRTTVTREDGSRIVTIRDAEYRVLRRVHIDRDGRQTLLVDDTVQYQPVDVTRLPPPAPVIEVDSYSDEDALREALSRQSAFDREFSLAQVRDIQQVRALVPVIDLTAITFETGSAAIRPDQAEELSRLGGLMKSYIDANPREMFLIEGHTDAVGSAASNLALSDRRAESVALAMSEYFDVPPENMVVQGYGEEFLKVQTGGSERANRRASVRRITDLLRQAAN